MRSSLHRFWSGSARRLLIKGTVLGVVATLGVVAAVAAQGGGPTFTGCVDPNNNGALRVTSDPTGSTGGSPCGTGTGTSGFPEHAVTWNAAGPAGPTGPQGVPGNAGGQGGQGGKGDQGPAGPGGSTTTIKSGNAVDILMTTSPDIKGGGPVSGKTKLGGTSKAIPLLSTAFSVENPVSFRGPREGQGGGGGAGKVKFNDLVITKDGDAGSPDLFDYLVTGKHFKTVELLYDRKGKAFLKIKLGLVFVKGYANVQTAQGQSPDEQFKLAYGSIALYNQDGGKQINSATWNQVLNSNVFTTKP